jgi:hypothetical protein
VHWITKKHVLRYLRGTMEYGLRYLGGAGVNLQGSIDSYWTGSAIDRKITSRCFFILGSTMITWFSGKQTFVSLSSVEEDYMASSMASYESIWIQK